MSGNVDGWVDRFKGKLKQDQIERRTGRAGMAIAVILLAAFLARKS